MGDNLIRNIIFSDEFEEYYASMSEQIKKKYGHSCKYPWLIFVV